MKCKQFGQILNVPKTGILGKSIKTSGNLAKQAMWLLRLDQVQEGT